MALDAIAALAHADADDTVAAGKALEAFVLRQLLAEVRSGSGHALGGGGFAGETFQEMLDSALADSMAGAGGVGLGKLVATPPLKDPR